MKKFLALLLTLALVLALGIPFASAAEATPEGTAIRSAAALKKMDVDGTYYLANDIIIRGQWRIDCFRGTLDGNGHTIYFDHAEVAGGLFAQLGGKEGAFATVKNLNIVELEEVTYTYANEGIGGLAAMVDLGHTVTVENVTVYANITNSVNKISMGGLVGDVRYCSLIMKNCVFSGSLKNYAGDDIGARSTAGMVGKTWASVSKLHIIECVNYGSLEAKARVGGMLGYSYPKSSTECLKELVVDKCVNYGDITSTLPGTLTDPSNNSGTGGIIGHHISYPDCHTTQITNNVNYGEVRGDVYHTLGSIAGQVQVSGKTHNATTLKVEGNVNYGTVKTVDGSRWGTGLIALWRTSSNGGITENNLRVHNYHNDGMNDNTLEDSIGASTEKRFSGTKFTDSAATLTTLNGAYPNTYVMSDGKIGLKWAVDAGYTAGFEIDIPSVGEIESAGSSVDKTTALTLDVTVPEATGTAISTVEELAAMASDGVYYLANDILITGEFKPIADFTGTLHGNGHAIVLNGAELRGGLFQNLAGGKVYNLSITEERENNPEDNAYRAYAMNSETLGLGTLAAYGYGTVVNVTVDCAVGSALKYTKNAYVGGLIGVVTDGNTVLYNCRNLAKVQGGNAGGLVGSVKGGEGKTEIARCANWGVVISSSGAAGGIIGSHSASTIRLFVSENVNYGAITTTASAYCGGIIGVQKNLWDGVAFFLNNANFGKVTCNYINEGENLGCPGGIIGCLDADSYAGATVSGNINYGEIVGNKTPNQLVGEALNNDGMTTAENNYAAAGSVAASVGAANGATLDANSLTALNAAYANVYAMQGEKINLKWAADMGLSSTAPVVDYSVDAPNDDNANTNNDTTDTTENNKNTTTEEPAEEKKGGCKSFVSGFGLVTILMMVCAAYLLVDKKRTIAE